MSVHWHVIGAGAIGCLFAAHLREANHHVTLLREGNECSITIERHGQIRQVAVESQTKTECIDHLLLATKAMHSLSALQMHAQTIHGSTRIVLLQNGMGQHEAVAQAYPQATVYAALSTEGAWRRAPLHSVHAGTGITRIGCIRKPPPADAESLMQAFSGCSLNTVWEPDIHQALWQKLAVNAAINGLAAIYDCPNGGLLDGGERQQRMRKLCEETAAVMQAEGLIADAESLYQQTLAVIETTADNLCSTLQDIRAGRPSEIEHINGFIVKKAEQHGISVPENRRLSVQLKN